MPQLRSPGPAQLAPASSSMNSIGPPSARPLASKKVHRRSPRACDECRLRKRACDAGQPCGPCHRSGISCSYQFRRPVPRPTSRIRDLQDHLQQARGWLQHIKDRTSGPVAGLDLDECLRAIDYTIPEDVPSSPPPSQPAAGRSHEPRLHRHGNMLMGHDRFMEKAPGVSCFYGAYSDISFILRTMELLKLGPAESQDERLCIMSNLLSRPLTRLPDTLNPVSSVYDVPDEGGSLLTAVFDRADLMLCFLTEQPLREAAADPRGPVVSRHSLQLLHVVLALGYLYSSQQHGGGLCGNALQQAMRHFHIAMTAGIPGLAQDLTSLQTVLCGIVFLLSSYRTSMAHSLIGTACSLALRLGLLSGSCLLSNGSPEDRKVRVRLLGAVLTVDMLGSIILDLPPFIHHDSVPHSLLLELAVGAETEGDLRTAAILRQCSLLAIPLSIRTQGTSSHADGQPEEANIRLFQRAVEDCQRWRRDVSPLIVKLAHDVKHRWARKDLDMMYNLSQIILFRPHLHYIREMYAGKAVSVAESYYALACIKVASSTIVMAEELRARPPLPLAESWLTLYTVFSAVVCLVFLVAAHPATTLPSIAWHKARVGIRLIAANKCADNISTVCLEVLKMVTHTLRETIYIDFDKIEGATATNCNRISGTPATRYRDTSEQSRSPESSSSGRRSSLMFDIETPVDVNRVGSPATNGADRMLEQAEALSMNASLEDLIDFSNSD